MELNTLYIKELIRKDILGKLTADEKVLLTDMRKDYSPEAYDDMEVEVLCALDEPLPPNPLSDWRPDMDAIIKRAKIIEGQPSGGRPWLRYAAAAAVLLVCLLGAGLYWGLTRDDEAETDFQLGNKTWVHRASNLDIPPSESSFQLYLGDSTWVQVTKDMRGKIRQVGDLLISRTEDGVLRLERRPMDGQPKPTIDSIQIYTAARQQCVIELENGAYVRMNAQTILKYPLQASSTTTIDLYGEAYVRSGSEAANNSLVIKTVLGKVSGNAEYVIRAGKFNTDVVVGQGTLQLYANSLKKDIQLNSDGGMGLLRTVRLAKDKELRDTLMKGGNVDFEMATRWMYKIRAYEKIPLITLVDDMSRWQGFTIKSWDCIPKDKYVNVSISYESDMEEVLRIIRKAGVVLHQQNEMISFCPEEGDERKTIVDPFPRQRVRLASTADTEEELRW